MSTTEDVESALPRGWRITYRDDKNEGYNSSSYRTYRLDRYEKVRTESPGAWFRSTVSEKWEWVKQYETVTSSRDDHGLSARKELVKFAQTQLDAEAYAREEERQQELERHLFPEK